MNVPDRDAQGSRMLFESFQGAPRRGAVCALLAQAPNGKNAPDVAGTRSRDGPTQEDSSKLLSSSGTALQKISAWHEENQSCGCAAGSTGAVAASQP